MSFIKSLSDLGQGDLQLAGGKAASLGDLTRAGFPVPPGFCITTDAYRAFVAANDLQAEIVRLSASAEADDLALLESTSAQIRSHFETGKIPADLAIEIRAAYARLTNPQSAIQNPQLAVAVRSSATAEDLPGASFAGQQETFLNIVGAEAVLEAVRQCWASLWTARAIAYRRREGIPPEDAALAVVVQQLIPAEAAGVLFTADPVTGARGDIVINAAWGLGEAIVSGLVTPDQIVVDKSTGLAKAKRIADKQVMTVRVAHGVEEHAVAEAQRNTPVLTEAQIATLTNLARSIESHAGRPMDVEWAVSGGRVFVLQARPITSLPPDLMGMEWSRQMLIERYPDPITPFTWSVMNATLFSSFETTFRILGGHLPEDTLLIRLMYGRAYINVTALHRGMASLPFRPPVASARSADRPSPFSLPRALAAAGRVLRLILTAHREWERRLASFTAIIAQETALAWETLPTPELLAGITRHEREMVPLLANHAKTIIATDLTLQTLQGLTRNWLGDEDGQLALTLLSGLTGNVTVQTNRALWRLAASVRENGHLRQAIAGESDGNWREQIALLPGGAEFITALDSFLQTYGHRSPRYEIRHPTWREKPEQVLQLLRLCLDDTVADPGEGEARKAAEREAATQAVRQRLSLPKRFLFDRVLALAQIYFRLRENQQFYLVLGLPMLRRILLTLGHRFCEAGLLREVEEVFFLENTEVWALAAQLAGLPANGSHAPGDPLRLVAERRAEFERNRQVNAPVHLGGEPGQHAESAGALRGIAASRGIVAGRARLVRGPEDFGNVQRGEIIVAPATTPAWTPLFGVAAGLVTEFGGLLSHAGVVAREYGLPAVLGVADATRRIQEGDEITVDGDRGEVRVKEGRADGSPSGSPPGTTS